MRAIALTDAVGNSLIDDVPMTGLTTSISTSRCKTKEIWSRKLNEIKTGKLGDIIEDQYFSLLANHLLSLGIPPNTEVIYGRVVRGKLRMISYKNNEYREFNRRLYIRHV
jgi:hypothetical protein